VKIENWLNNGLIRFGQLQNFLGGVVKSKKNGGVSMGDVQLLELG
jgi:hypothetical protein